MGASSVRAAYDTLNNRRGRTEFMRRINEKEAARDFVKKLESGVYPLERAKNNGVDYGEVKEERDTKAVRESVKSALFEKYKNMD